MVKKTRRYLFTMVIVIPLAWVIWPASAMADIGPKPTLEIRVTGYENPDDYYLDLLVSGVAPNPENVWAEMKDEPIYQYCDGERAAAYCHGLIYLWGSIHGERTDNCYILHYFEYMGVPDKFSIIVQNRLTGDLTISDTVQTKQLNAIVEYDAITNQVRVIHNFSGLWWYRFCFRVVLTVLIESILAYAFHFKRNRWLPIPINLITQGILHLGLIFLYPVYFKINYVTAFLIMETCVILIEFIVYIFWMGEKKHWPKTLAYTLAANGITMAIGLWLMA